VHGAGEFGRPSGIRAGLITTLPRDEMRSGVPTIISVSLLALLVGLIKDLGLL
jgi:hypothetical protein